MKYKVGDKVRVRKDLVVGKRYGSLDCLRSHKKDCGKIFTIEATNGKDEYRLNDSIFWWSEEMFEDVEGIDIFVDGNKVIAKKDGKVGIAKCSPDDEFDLFIGAKLALARLEETCKQYAWLEKGVNYYVPIITSSDLCAKLTYYNDVQDCYMKEHGLAFKTKEEAVEAAKKMLAVLKEGDSNG